MPDRPAEAEEKPSRRRLWLKRITISAVSFLLSLLVVFLAFEFVLAPYLYSDVDRYHEAVYDSELGWCLQSGEYEVKSPGSFRKHTLSINELGLRNEPIEPEPASGTTRVMVLGDSFTFGRITSTDSLFTTRLENLLDAEGNYEVVNAGVPGYGNGQQLLLLRRLKEQGVSSQIFVLCMFTNDLLDNLGLDYGTIAERPNQPSFTLDVAGKAVLDRRPRERSSDEFDSAGASTPRFKSIAILKSKLQSFAQSRPRLIRLAERIGFSVDVKRMPGVINAWYDDELLERGQGLMQALLVEIKAEVEGSGGTLLVALIPSPIQVYSETYGPIIRASFPNSPRVSAYLADPARPHRIVGQMCAELELPFLDLYEIYRAEASLSLFVPGDGHFNADGHALAALSLRTFLMQTLAGK